MIENGRYSSSSSVPEKDLTVRPLEPKVANAFFFKEVEGSVNCRGFFFGPGFAVPFVSKRYTGRREGKHEVTMLRLISVPAQITIGDIVQLTSREAVSSLEQTTKRMIEIATTLKGRELADHPVEAVSKRESKLTIHRT